MGLVLSQFFFFNIILQYRETFKKHRKLHYRLLEIKFIRSIIFKAVVCYTFGLRKEFIETFSFQALYT